MRLAIQVLVVVLLVAALCDQSEGFKKKKFKKFGILGKNGGGEEREPSYQSVREESACKQPAVSTPVQVVPIVQRPIPVVVQRPVQQVASHPIVSGPASVASPASSLVKKPVKVSKKKVKKALKKLKKLKKLLKALKKGKKGFKLGGLGLFGGDREQDESDESEYALAPIQSEPRYVQLPVQVVQQPVYTQQQEPELESGKNSKLGGILSKKFGDLA